MTVLRFDGAEGSSFDLSDTRNLRIAQVLTTDATNWRYTNENGTTVQFLGTNLVYDETGRPISGTIDTVRVVLPSGDVFAIDQVLDAASIAAQPETLWDTVMSGKDVINVIELGSEANDTSTVFGDAIAAARSRDSKVVTGIGGNDVFILGSGSYRLLGDLETVSGVDFPAKASAGAKDLFARYQGGDDLITGAETDKRQTISGDAGFVGAHGTLLGGDDNLSILASLDDSILTGDAEEAFGIKGAVATVIGGDDDIKGLRDSVAVLIGDLTIANDFVVLKGGDDTIDGSTGSEFISGDLGAAETDEKVSVTGGDDLIDGGNGDDTIAGEAFFVLTDDANLKASNGRPGKVTRLTVEGGDDVIDGGGGSDTIYGEAALIGSSKSVRAADQPRISGGNDTISGGADDDLIFGQTGNDKISGDAGNDELFGGSGKDRITGGTGADRLSGGAGADLFVFNDIAESNSSSADLVVDFFSRQGDRIDLRLIDADTTQDGIQAFDFIGKSTEGQTGQLRVERIDGATVLAADVDGLGGDDFRIVFEGKVRLTEDDFLF